jgi:hypothetical protein
MSVRQIGSAMLRRWYISLAALVCVAVATVMLAQDGGIYTTRTVISLLRPTTTSLSPDNGTTDRSVIAFAAAVALDTNGGELSEGYSKADAPLFGAGVREGTLVELAEIQIDIVGRTSDWVESRQEKLVARALATAKSLQDAVGVPPENQVSAYVVPLTTQIEYVAPSRRAQLAAAVAMLAAALIVAAWASVTVDGALAKRRSHAGRSNQEQFKHRIEG